MMQHYAGETNQRMLTKMIYKNMTCRQSRFSTLDTTGFSLCFINLRFSRFFFITEIVCTIWQYDNLQAHLFPLSYTKTIKSNLQS